MHTAEFVSQIIEGTITVPAEFHAAFPGLITVAISPAENLDALTQWRLHNERRWELMGVRRHRVLTEPEYHELDRLQILAGDPLAESSLWRSGEMERIFEQLTAAG